MGVDVESFDGVLGQRHRQAAVFQDDAAHVPRTGREVLVTHGAHLEPALTQVEVRLRGHGVQNDAERQVAVHSYTEVGTVEASEVHYRLAQILAKTTEYIEKTQRRVNHRVTILRLGNLDHVSIHEQTSARRKQRPVHKIDVDTTIRYDTIR